MTASITFSRASKLGGSIRVGRKLDAQTVLEGPHKGPTSAMFASVDQNALIGHPVFTAGGSTLGFVASSSSAAFGGSPGPFSPAAVPALL